MTSTKPPTEGNPTANDDAAETHKQGPRPSQDQPEPEGCTVEELLEAFPRMFENA